MYKLLLASDDPEVLKAFREVPNWPLLGFHEPRVVSTAAEAEESLKKHHADGVSFALSGEENEELGRFLTDRYPLLPIMLPSRDHDQVIRDLSELAHFLDNIYSDTADERYDLAEQMRWIRHAYFRTLISGKVHSREAVLRRLSILRSRMDPDTACVLIRFALPPDDGYLAGRWHYGPERLEIAMRNFFGAELQGMRLLVSVLEDDQIYLLACPMRGCERPDGESMTGIVKAHAEDCIAHVHEFLGIEMSIDAVTVLPTVLALADSLHF